MIVIRCVAAGCDRQHSNDHWSKVKAHGAGWFEQKDGTTFCPEHVPSWVTQWRARKEKS